MRGGEEGRLVGWAGKTAASDGVGGAGAVTIPPVQKSHPVTANYSVPLLRVPPPPPPRPPLGSKVHYPRESVVLGGLPGADTPSQDSGLFPESQASSLIQVFLAKTHRGADEQSSDVRGNTPLDKGLCSSCQQTELVSMP